MANKQKKTNKKNPKTKKPTTTYGLVITPEESFQWLPQGFILLHSYSQKTSTFDSKMRKLLIISAKLWYITTICQEASDLSCSQTPEAVLMGQETALEKGRFNGLAG